MSAFEEWWNGVAENYSDRDPKMIALSSWDAALRYACTLRPLDPPQSVKPARAPHKEDCKLCAEGIPLKEYFDGRMMHFDGFMAWTECTGALVGRLARRQVGA